MTIIKKSNSRLIGIVNHFQYMAEETGLLSEAILDTANVYNVPVRNVAEAVFPYVDNKVRNRLLSMKSLTFGAQFIYRMRINRTRGFPASRMPRYLLAS